MEFHYILALHIIFIVTWFAGLFYMPRLFIYHVEAEKKPELEKKILQTQFKIMEKNLWYIITWPSMILTLLFGPWMVILNPSYLTHPYFILKLCFVFGLIVYHFRCHIIFKQLQNDIIKTTSFRLRLFNEIATVFLFAIVFIIVLKDQTSFIWGLLGLIVFAAMMFVVIKMYKKSREKNEQK
ncbi:MAG: CopD family protein [Bacteroidia bacterium]